MLVPFPMRLVWSGGALIIVAACGLGSGRPDPELDPHEAQVGYGTRPERDITGAVTSLSEQELSAGRPLRIEELLQGRVAGLQFIRQSNGGTTIRIRGSSSIANDREPLLVVDGVPLRSPNLMLALAGLIPEDILRVDVLKDVASTSIYGMSGAGGVIIITTRR